MTLNDDDRYSGGSMTDDGRYVVFSQSHIGVSNSFGDPQFGPDGCRKLHFLKDMQLNTLQSFALPKTTTGHCGSQGEPVISGDGKFIFIKAIGPVLFRDLVTRDVDTWFRLNLSTNVVDNAPRQTGGFTLPNNGTFGYGDPVVGLPLELVSGSTGESFAFILDAGSGARTKMWHRTIKDVTSGSVELPAQDFAAKHGNRSFSSSFYFYFDLSPNDRYLVYTEEFTAAPDPHNPTSKRVAVRYIRYDTVQQTNNPPLLTEFSGRPGDDFLYPMGTAPSGVDQVFAQICGMNADASKIMLYSNIKNSSNPTGLWSTGNAVNILVYDVASKSVKLGQNRNMFSTPCASMTQSSGPPRNMSADGNILVTKDGSDLYVFNVAKNKTLRIVRAGFSQDFQISRNGKYILQSFGAYDTLPDGSTLGAKYPYALVQFLMFGPILEGDFN